MQVKVLVTQLCLTLCDPMDSSPPGSSVHGILQARILKWVAISCSRGSSWPRDQTQSPASPALASVFFTPVPPGKLNHSPLQVINPRLLENKECCFTVPMKRLVICQQHLLLSIYFFQLPPASSSHVPTLSWFPSPKWQACPLLPYVSLPNDIGAAFTFLTPATNTEPDTQGSGSTWKVKRRWNHLNVLFPCFSFEI